MTRRYFICLGLGIFAILGIGLGLTAVRSASSASGPNYARMSSVAETKCHFSMGDKPSSDGYGTIAGQDGTHYWVFDFDGQWNRTGFSAILGGALVSENGKTLCPGQYDSGYIWNGQTFEPGVGTN